MNLPLYWQALLACTVVFFLYVTTFILARLSTGTRPQKKWLREKKKQLKEF